MKTIGVFMAIAAAAVSTDAAKCDMGAIQGKLYPNATAGLKECATKTGYDIWQISNFPTPDQAKAIMKERNCVDFLNQINNVANSDIQCDITVGGATKDFGGFLVSLLTGKTGNETESASGSGSEDIELPEEHHKNKTVATKMPSAASATKAPTEQSSAATITRTVLIAGVVTTMVMATL